MKALPRLYQRLLQFCLLIFCIVFISEITHNTWGNREENKVDNQKIIINNSMTIAEYGNTNRVPCPVLIKIFNLKNLSDTNYYISSLKNINNIEIQKKTKAEVAEFNEEHSKNPIRYTVHFILSLLFMAVVFYFIRKSHITPTLQKYFFLISIIVFGLGFNSNPSPMGPLNDTISVLGNFNEIFHPRLLAILTYLIIVIVANKFICSWVCQFGVLQDFIFRLNRTTKNNKAIIKQIKIPFLLSNSIRITFFIATTVISILWTVNIIDSINPFYIFNGSQIKLFGWFFVGSILITSIFIYRPWCHLFCPFGLLSWLFESLSIYKIRVNFKTCNSCNICAKSCPSEAMSAILAQKKILPDCFSCGTCISACPNNSIKYGVNKPNCIVEKRKI